MGMSAFDLDTPVGKGNNAVLAFEKYSEPVVTNCIRCGRCIKACPFDLMPTEMEKAYKRRDVEALKKAESKFMHELRLLYLCLSGRKKACRNKSACQSSDTKEIRKAVKI